MRGGGGHCCNNINRGVRDLAILYNGSALTDSESFVPANSQKTTPVCQSITTVLDLSVTDTLAISVGHDTNASVTLIHATLSIRHI